MKATKKTSKVPRIKDLTGPRGIRRLYAYGLRLTAGTTVSSALEETGFPTKHLSLRFARAGAAGIEPRIKDILLEKNIKLSRLPKMAVSTLVLARAAQDPSVGENLQNLGAIVFGHAIDALARVRLIHGVHVKTLRSLIKIAIRVGRFRTVAICDLADLDGFVEVHSDRDQELESEEQ